MGMFKAMKDMKQMVAVAPSMIQEAQYLQANAMQVQAQHASAQRWYLDVRLERPEDVDRELKSWLAGAMRLAD